MLSSSTHKKLLGKEYFPRDHLPPYLSSLRSNENDKDYQNMFEHKSDGISDDHVDGSSGGVGGDGDSLSASGTNMAGVSGKECSSDNAIGEGIRNSASEVVLNGVQSFKSLFTSSTAKLTGKDQQTQISSTQTVSPTNHIHAAAEPGTYGIRMDIGDARTSPSRAADKSTSFNQINHLSSLQSLTLPSDLSPQRSKSTGDPVIITDAEHNIINSSTSSTVIPTWRLKERMKTVGVGLILALNIGTDPPDANKPNPCAKLQCWMDPTSISRAKARERIGQRLESQYARWQQRTKLNHKRALDPTVEDVRNLCLNLRRSARKERVLLHYNGHGVPKPTPSGEIWVFDMNHTQYIPLAVGDLKRWIGKPSLIVLDCSAAGALLPFLISNNTPISPGNMGGGVDSFGDGFDNAQTHGNSASINVGIQSRGRNDNGGLGMSNMNNINASNVVQHISSIRNTDSTNNVPLQSNASSIPNKFNRAEETEDLNKSVHDIIVLCPTSAFETLPLNPELPADLFTSCLTTPIPTALRWFVHQNPISCSNLPAENVDLIPGDLSDRKTPLGELNWIFTAITDTIAWSVLPSSLFQRLFRQDLLVASMFRNFLLADRILRDLNCTPMSYPTLPSTCDHPLWQAWDLAVETCLSCLMRNGVLGVLRDSTNLTNGGIEGVSSEVTNRALSHNNTSESEHAGDDKDDSRIRENAAIKLNGAVLNGNGGRANREQGANITSYGSKIASNNNVRKNVSSNNGSSNEMPQNMPYNVSAPFFAEQLTAFEIWLDFAAMRIKNGGIILNPPLKQYVMTGSDESSPFMHISQRSTNIASPEQLPIVLQVLLSPAHRVRALVLLERFHHLGPSAVNIALSVGIFPYVLKLLQSHIDEYKHVLVGIWCKILEFDPSCQADLVKDGALRHFVKHLHWGLPDEDESEKKDHGGPENTAYQRTMAAVILSAICHKYPPGQTECVKRDAHNAFSKLLRLIEYSEEKDSNLSSANRILLKKHFTPQFRMWICIFLAVFAKDHVLAQSEAIKSELHLRLFIRLCDDSSDVRAAACFALGSLIKADPSTCLKSNEVRKRSGDTKQILDNAVVVKATQGSASFKKAMPSSSFGMNSSIVHKPNPVGHISWQPQQKSKQSYGLLSKGGGINQRLSSQNMGILQQSQKTVEQEQEYSALNNEFDVACDLTILKEIVEASSDACPTVRYEAITVIGKAVGKYLKVFAALADKVKDTIPGPVKASHIVPPLNQKFTHMPQIPMPEGVDVEIESAFENTWKRLRSVQNNDPHPGVSRAAKNIVRFVNEHILVLKTNLRTNNTHRRRIIDRKNEPNNTTLPEDEDENYSIKPYDNYMRSASTIDLRNAHQRGVSEGANSEMGRLDKSQYHLYPPTMRRNHSVVLGPNDINETNLYISFQNQGIHQWLDAQKEQYKVIQESEFYEWKRSEFNEESGEKYCSKKFAPLLDPLSSEGAIQIYREERNRNIDKEGNALAESFASLGPKPSPRQNLDNLSSFIAEDEEKTSAAAVALEAEVRAKKKALDMKQSALLTNHGKRFMLRFHSYENILVASDDSDTISIWDTQNSSKMNHFKNENPNKTQMTSMLWINERNNSLLLTGCDDGSVRLWDKIIASDGTIRSGKPALSTAFFAMPELVAGIRGSSGLIMEWQESHGRLITSGSTNLIRCWDLESEKCTNVIDSKINDACLTAMTIAWDNNGLGDANFSTSAEGYSGMGPNILFAGYKDGTLKVFDLRSHQRGGVSEVQQTESKYRSRLSKKTPQYSEHSNWIVNTSFIRYGDKCELISGCVAGGIKFWDLRFSRSIRTVESPKTRGSAMTALACHPRVPLFAAGSASHISYVKLFTPDGDTLQFFRNHEIRPEERIGPISCLAFHPNKLRLAVGATNGIISIYQSIGL